MNNKLHLYLQLFTNLPSLHRLFGNIHLKPRGSVRGPRGRTEGRHPLPRQRRSVGTEPMHTPRKNRFRQSQIRRGIHRRGARGTGGTWRGRRRRGDLGAVGRRGAQQARGQTPVHRGLPRAPALRPETQGNGALAQVDLLRGAAAEEQRVQIRGGVPAAPGSAPHLDVRAGLLHHGGGEEGAGVVVFGVQGVARVQAEGRTEEVLVHEEGVHGFSVTRRNRVVRSDNWELIIHIKIM